MTTELKEDKKYRVAAFDGWIDIDQLGNTYYGEWANDVRGIIDTKTLAATGKTEHRAWIDLMNKIIIPKTSSRCGVTILELIE